MAQCNHCGSSIYATERFCMECGTVNPAYLAQAPGANPSGAQAAAAHNPAPAQPQPPAALPADASFWQNQTLRDTQAPAQAPMPAQEGDSIVCPKCAARLPRGARFCGDCGTRLPGASAAMPAPAPARPARVATAALPDPIPPLPAGPGPKPASGPAQSVLPPFRASAWVVQPTPDVAIPDHTMTPLSNEQAAPGPWSAAQPQPWQPQGSSKASSFTPPTMAPQGPPGAAPLPGPPPMQQTPWSASPSQAPFMQARAAVPSMQGARRQSRYPRGQVITMMIAAIVTVTAALGGFIVLLLGHR